MIRYRTFSICLVLAAFMITGIAATRPPEGPEHKNLKVLPKNISHEDLDKVMDGFKAALGVKCGFCHAHSKDSTSHELDFASDEKAEKNIARTMMKMTTKINKKFFNYKDEHDQVEPPVSCMTCHHGSSHPETK